MANKTWAVMVSGSNVVDNIIVADEAQDLSTLLSGYSFQQVTSGVFCMPGMYFNSADGLYYVDFAFTETTVPANYSDISTS